MKRFRLLLVLPICFGLIFSGCVGNVSTPVGEDGDDAYSIIGADYRNRGITPYESIDDKLVSASGCKVAYTYYKSRDLPKDTLVVLGHGFMRSKKRMTYLAQHLASWGLSVVNVEFCNSKLWAGNHDRNGADMVAVSQILNTGKVIYIGFSAGGLAALLAADRDENTQALFGLDMVDHRELGNKIAPALTVPFYGLIAAPSACNAHNNGLDAYASAPHSRVLEVADASHCHFEFPADEKCLFVCGKGEKQVSRTNIQQAIVGLTTAFLLWQTGIDVNGQTWWESNQLPHRNAYERGTMVWRHLCERSMRWRRL